MTTTTSPARGTDVPPVGKGLAAGASPAPRGLTDPQLATLGRALADAISYRDPGGDCTACQHDPYVPCGDHGADLDKADAYCSLAAELGIELEEL